MRKLLVIALMLPLIAACSTKVNRMDVDAQRDLSGGWNATDSRMVSESMIEEALGGIWLNRFLTAHGGREPVVIIGTVDNQSREHINTNTFIEELQRALINSGKVRFVAGASERGEIRTERLEQDEYASEATRKAFGQEIGADFMLNGILSDIVDREGNRSVVFYQVNLRLVNIQTNEIVWNGQKQIKKFVDRRSLRIF